MLPLRIARVLRTLFGFRMTAEEEAAYLRAYNEEQARRAEVKRIEAEDRQFMEILRKPRRSQKD